jgi:hypothetical protein
MSSVMLSLKSILLVCVKNQTKRLQHGSCGIVLEHKALSSIPGIAKERKGGRGKQEGKKEGKKAGRKYEGRESRQEAGHGGTGL